MITISIKEWDDELREYARDELVAEYDNPDEPQAVWGKYIAGKVLKETKDQQGEQHRYKYELNVNDVCKNYGYTNIRIPVEEI